LPLRENFEEFSYNIKERYEGLRERFGFLPLLILVIFIIAIGFFIMNRPVPPEVKRVVFSAYFTDEQGLKISGIDVNFIFDGNLVRKKTNAEGKVSISVPQNILLQISAGGGLYQDEKWSFSIGLEDIEKTFKLKLKEKPLEKRVIRFENEKGSTKGKTAKAKISCSNKAILPWEESDNDKDGLIDVTLPLNCGEIKIVNASLEGHTFDRTVQKGNEIIVLFKQIEIPKGKLRVKVLNDKKELILNKNIKVTLEHEGEQQSAFTQGYGLVEFSALLPGTYHVYANDPDQEYSSGSTDADVKANETTETFVEMRRTIRATILVRVLSSDNQSALEGASVKLLESQEIIAEDKTQENGIVRFSLFEFGLYKIIAKKEGYFSKTIDFNVFTASDSVTIELEKITEQNSGRTIVKVLDEDGLAVKDAKVMFKYKSTDAIVELPSSQNYKLTDENGIAEFYLGNVKEDIYPYAIKYPASGGSASQARKIIPDETNYFEVVLQIGKSTLNIRAFGTDGKLLEESYFEVFSAIDNNSITKGKLLMVDGTYKYDIKAAQRVYIVVSREGYGSYQSNTLQLWPKQVYNIDALLLKEGEIIRPKIEFLGVFEGNTKAASLKAGKEYEFRFQAVFPKTNASKLGFHFRAGDSNDVALEPAFISNVNVSADSIKMGKTYAPYKSEASEELTSRDAKWVSVEWQNPKADSYAISIVVKLRENIGPKTKMNFYYRSYAVVGQSYLREPYDSELMELEKTENKDGLYAACHSLTYFEGSEALCKEPFCITGTWLYDAQEDIFVKEPYNLIVFGDYNFIFELMNNSQKDYNNILLTLENSINGKPDSALEFEKAVISSDAQPEEIAPVDNKFKVELKEFSYAKLANANVRLRPKKETTTGIEIGVIAEKQLMLSKYFTFKVYSVSKLDVNLEPASFAPFTEYTLKINVRDSEKRPVKDALITVARNANDGTSEVMQKMSDGTGLAAFKIVGSYPGTKIEIRIEKIGYMPVTILKEVDKNIAKVTPESVRLSLSTRAKPEDSIPFSIENKSGTELMIKKIRFSGNFNGLLDETTMNANASTQEGRIIKAQTRYDLALKAMLSNDAEKILQKNESVSGSIELLLSVPKYGAEYAIIIPLNVNILLGDLPENAPCISLAGPDVPEWNVTTINNVAKTDLEITNLCMQNGKPIDLENLQVRMDWASGSKKAGSVEIRITSPDGSTATKVLRPGIWTKMFDNFKNGLNSGAYRAIITFVPNQEYLGETARFTLQIDGQTKTSSGLKFVGADSKINAKILILNLKDCVKYPKEKIVMKSSEKEVKFTIDSNTCNIDVSVLLCKDDEKCRGGTQEGGITLEPNEEIKLTRTERSKTVTAYREQIPGQYGITVYAKAADSDYQQLGTIDLVIEPEAHKYFSMSRYELTLSSSTNWRDSADLINRMWTEKVNITARLCTACKDPNKKPDYCVMNIALERSALAKSPNAEAILGSIGAATAAGYLAIKILEVAGITAAAPIVVPIAVIAVFLGVMMLLEGPECTTEMATFPFTDYVINLPQDFKSLKISDPQYSVSYGEAGESSYSTNTQTMPLTFEKKSQKPENVKYAILEIKATEHIHNDPTHKNPEMSREKADFKEFDVPDSETKEYVQKFHLKLKSKGNVGEKMVSVEGTEACALGTKTGITGENVLPKIKLDWSWQGIEWDSCDADNQQGFYCDATQFSIALSKRINKLNGFFKANNYTFSCPTNPYTKGLEELIKKVNEEKSTHAVESGKIGVSKLEYQLNEASASVTLRATVENKTSQDQTAKVNFLLKKSDYSKECTKEVNVGAGGQSNAECKFDNLEKTVNEAYFASALLTEAEQGNIDSTAVIVGFIFASSDGSCWLPYSTRKIEGRPAILYFIDRSIPQWQEYINVTEIKWPDDWPGSNAQEKIEFLKKLIEFDALLVKDAYNDDFRNDFVEYYTGKTFFEIPAWFSGKEGLKAYFEDKDAMKFETGYDTRLPGPGRYNIFLQIDFNDRFSFFKEGKLNASINVIYKKLEEPNQDSVFYYWPIDGEVGIGSANGRVGYGTSYTNKNNALSICKYGNAELKTDSKQKTGALVALSTEIKDSFEYTNIDAQTRGNILNIEINDNDLSLTFSPNVASLAIMKVSGESEKEVTASYQLMESGNVATFGNILSYWNGVSNCKDFSGEALNEAFSNTPDERIEGSKYGLRWNKSTFSGDIYLYSLFFTPTSKMYALSSASQNVKFITPELSETATLEFKSDNETSVMSIQDLITLLADKRICISAEGNNISFWWNPTKIVKSDSLAIISKKCTNSK